MRGAQGTFLLGALLALVAGGVDAEPLWIPGVVFLLLGAGTSAWVALGARGLRVTRTVDRRTVIEEEPVVVSLRVRAGALPLPTGVVDDPLLPAPAPLAAGRRRTDLQITARYARRGRKVLNAPRVVVRDPFGLAVREVAAATPDDELLVLPRVLPVQATAADGDEGGLAPRTAREHIAAEIDLDGLRPHRDGAPASRIVWPVWARTGELVERRLRAETDTRPLVVLDPRGAAAPEDLDAAVRATASLAVHFARGGGCALLLPGTRRPVTLEPSLAAWPRAHVRLALVADGGTAPLLQGLAARRGPLVYVAARVLQRPPRALGGASGGLRLLVVPGRLPGRRAAFDVAGCHGYALGGTVVRRSASTPGVVR